MAMEQHEKWFDTDKLIDRLNTNYTNNVCSGLTWDTIIEVSEYTWKAGVRWALDVEREYNESAAARIISEELGNESS